MFTGIITEMGTVMQISRTKIAIRASGILLRKLDIGTSIAVDGACLTVVKNDRGSFVANVMPETTRRTTLQKLCSGDAVNLELPATPSSFLSGHIVQGHVDGMATVKKIGKDGTSHVLTIELPESLARFVVEKGSVAVNGISLTIIDVGTSSFTVGIIPHTWKTTNLHALKTGNQVNVETDIMAKYIEKIMKKHGN